MTLGGYEFRSMQTADLPTIRRWLETPHVMEWWNDPEEQMTLVRGDLDHPEMDQFIVAQDDRAFAYLQCYDITSWPDVGFGRHPDGTRAIDQFIGEADMIDCGHGSAFIRAYIETLLTSGTPRVLTDPDPENRRAVRAYEKAGFHKMEIVNTLEGRALLMIRNA